MSTNAVIHIEGSDLEVYKHWDILMQHYLGWKNSIKNLLRLAVMILIIKSLNCLGRLQWMQKNLI